jgi:IMP dehydrogenase/GMP reductase
MASEDVMKERGIKRAAEGVTSKVRATKTLEEILQELTDGIQSGLSYLGFNSLQELKENRDSIFAHLITNASRAENSTL